MISFKKITEKWQTIVYENHFLSNRYRVATFSSSSSIEDYRGTWWWTQRSIRTRNYSPIKVFPFCTSFFSSLPLLLLTPIFSNPFTVFLCVFLPRLSSLRLSFYIFPSQDTYPACFSQYRIYSASSTIVKLAPGGPRKVFVLVDVYHVAFFGLNDQTYPGWHFDNYAEDDKRER